MKIHKWNAITPVSNMRTISKLLAQKAIAEYFLQSPSWRKRSSSAGNSAKAGSNAILQHPWPVTNLKFFWEKPLENPPPLWTTSGARLEGTPSTSRKISKIGLYWICPIRKFLLSILLWRFLTFDKIVDRRRKSRTTRLGQFDQESDYGQSQCQAPGAFQSGARSKIACRQLTAVCQADR